MLKHSLIALAALAGMIGASATGASAFPAPPQPIAKAGAASPLTQEVRMNKGEWSPGRDGGRCRSRSNHCRHYHNGWYYANPWWVLPFVGAGIALGSRDGGRYDGYGSRHVEWCMDRYRSYDPRDNTWVSYSGRVHDCVSPYGP